MNFKSFQSILQVPGALVEYKKNYVLNYANYVNKNYDIMFLILPPSLSFCYLQSVSGHGRPQTFFQGRAKIFQGGARTYFLPKKQRKRYYLSKKSLKTYYFWPARGGGKSPPLPSPADAHGGKRSKIVHFLTSLMDDLFPSFKVCLGMIRYTFLKLLSTV